MLGRQDGWYSSLINLETRVKGNHLIELGSNRFVHLHYYFHNHDTLPQQLPEGRSYLRLDDPLGIILQPLHLHLAEIAFRFEIFERREKNRFFYFTSQVAFNLSRNCLGSFFLNKIVTALFDQLFFITCVKKEDLWRTRTHLHRGQVGGVITFCSERHDIKHSM